LNFDRHALVSLTMVAAAGSTSVSLFYILILRYYWLPWLNNSSAFSLLSVSLIYMASASSNESDLGAARTIIYSALYCVAFVSSYELLYHFTWPVYLDYFGYPYGVNFSNLAYLAVFLPLVIIPLYLIRTRIRITKFTIAFVIVFVVIWAAWILTGFPQYFTIGTFYYRPFFSVSDYWNESLVLNYGSKMVLAGLFLSMVYSHAHAGLPFYRHREIQL
jgi:hypothetical protein